MPAKKTPRPADTYRGARRNALKAGAKLLPHRWQTQPNFIDGGNRRTRLNTPRSRPSIAAYAKDTR
jgi:hypothetical protein